MYNICRNNNILSDRRKVVIMKRSISILLVIMMVFSTMSMCVFATEDVASSDEQTEAVAETTEETSEVAEDETAEVASEEAVEESAEAEVEEETAEEVSEEAVESKLGTLTAKNVSTVKVKVTLPSDATGTILSVTKADGTAVTATIADDGKSAKITDNDFGSFQYRAVVDEKGNYYESAAVTVPYVTEDFLTAYSSYESIALEWIKLANAKYYIVERRLAGSDDEFTRIKTLNAEKVSPTYTSLNKVSYIDTTVARSHKSNLYYSQKKYEYRVRAKDANGVWTDYSNTAKDAVVREMYIKVTFKVTRALTSHDGKNKHHTYKAGTTVKTHGFGGGKYQFYDEKGNLYYVSYLNTVQSKAKALYTGQDGFNYGKREAEYFINRLALTSKEKKLKKKGNLKYRIWVNGYTQHLYIFKRTKAKNGKYYWKAYRNWEVSTGKASTPSPVGITKHVWQKIPSRHGLGPWTSFQSMSSFHGAFKDWVKKLGTPQSGACIRNKFYQSKWIYKNVPIGTRVSIF